MIELEIHLATEGRAGANTKGFPARAFDRIKAALETRATVTHAVHVEHQGHAEFIVELPGQWDRTIVLGIARAVFRNSRLRGGIAAHFKGETFFQLSTPGGAEPLRWREDEVPTVPVSRTGEESR